MKKFVIFTALIWLGLFRLNGQQIMPNQPVGQVQQPVTTPQQPIMQAGQPVTTPGQPATQGLPFTQGQSVQGANSGLTIVHISMVVLGQAATSTNGGPMAFHFTQS